MDTKRPISAASAKAPFLRMVSPADTPESPPESSAAVLSSFAIPDIDPLGRRPSAMLRIVAWPLQSGRWALGVLEETWPNDRLGQGDPSGFRLWQTPQEFNLQSMAQAQVDFWSSNKTASLVRRQLLGERDVFEDAVAGPPMIADTVSGTQMPFPRPVLRARRAVARNAVPVQQ